MGHGPSLATSDVVPLSNRFGNQSTAASRVRVVGLKVDYVERPFGLQNVRPHFSWRLDSSARNVRQTAYRILVSSELDTLHAGQGDVWDSGKIASQQCLSVPYEGKPLMSRQRCWWFVQVWDEHGQSFVPLEPSWWEMGLLSPDDWCAQWIAADDTISKEDRETPLAWMWGDEDDQSVSLRWFRVLLDVPEATRGGVLFANGRSPLDKVVGVWLAGGAIAEMSPDCDFAGENLHFGPLSRGQHWLLVAVRRQNPWPEYFAALPVPGLALFARLETNTGRMLRLVSGSDWQTRLATATSDVRGGIEKDETWRAVSVAAFEGHLLREPGIYLRREFSAKKEACAARLYTAALGCFEATLNGQRIDDALLTPEVSEYEKRILYRVYDVSKWIRRGANVIGFMVGDGWYAGHPGQYSWGPPPRRLIAQLELTYSDGTREVIVTDPSWRCARSPIRQSLLCIGEVYDARLEQPKWDTSDFDASNWSPAAPAVPPPGKLYAQVSPPIRATQVLTTVAITSPVPGVYVFDFGQNFAGWCRLRIKGMKGTRIDLRYGEQIKPNGEIDQFSLNGRKAIDSYILSGDPGGEVFEPHFTYHGFRYVQVTGLPIAPSIDMLEGVVLHTDLERTGYLRVDHPLIERLWQNILWTQRSNFVAVGTDCCNRAERMGYFLDMGVFWGAATFNMDVAAFTRRQLDNARDHQYETGALSSVAPAPAAMYNMYRSSDGTATPGWGDGVVILAWTSWRRYGDIGVLEQNWEAMNRGLQFVLDRNPNYLWLNGRKPDLGDWLAIDEQHFMRPEIPPTTPLEVFATAHWAHSADLLAQIADALNLTNDATRLRAVHQQVCKAFIEAYIDADGQVGNGSQTSYVLALKFNLVPAARRQQVVQRLVEDIRKRGCALSTGLFGTQYLLEVLADAGFVELAYTLLLRRAYPSWGYMIEHGASTIWERWDGSLEKNYLCASHNHPAFGSVGSFLFRSVAGIEEVTPGFQRIRVRPRLDSRVPRGGGDYYSVMGLISTTWVCSSDSAFTLEVRIPANCMATVHLPAHREDRILESGADIARRTELAILSRSDEEMLLQVGSGRYHFFVEPASLLRHN